MYNYCTLFDSNYLTRGLAMYESLKRYSNNFHLYIFAFDDGSYKLLKKLGLEYVTIISLKDFENMPESLWIGYNGKDEIWLQKNLRLLGYFQGREAPLYGPKTVQAMMKLQRKNSIKDDGIFNTDSKLLLYNLLQIYSTPRLVSQ